MLAARRASSGVLEAGRSPKGAWAQCHRRAHSCKCSSCCWAVCLRTAAEVGVVLATGLRSALPEQGPGCKPRAASSWRALPPPPAVPVPPAGATSSVQLHPGARTAGRLLGTGPRPRPPRDIRPAAWSPEPTGVPHELLEPTSERELAPGQPTARLLTAHPTRPKDLYSRSVAAPISWPCAEQAPLLGSRPLRPSRPCVPGQRAGGPWRRGRTSWSLPAAPAGWCPCPH